jgi:hypothetical protein
MNAFAERITVGAGPCAGPWADTRVRPYNANLAMHS